MLKKMIVLFFFLFLTVLNGENFESFKKKEDKAQKIFNKKQKSYKLLEATQFLKYKERIAQNWQDFIKLTPEKWISYSDKFNSRSSVDFKKGKVKIEVVLTSKQDRKADKEILSHLEKIMKENTGDGKGIIDNQIENPDSKRELRASEIDRAIPKILKNKKVKKITTISGEEKFKYEINLNLVPNHIKIRAKKYKKIIEDNCKRFNVSAPLVMAIIHAESYFNPKAYNAEGNAVGMMQIVPKYAGSTMNNYLYGKKRKPTLAKLFNPKINLEMGIGYLHWLKKNKWNQVTKADNLTYCLICSYNGGVGSVYKAILNKMRKISHEEFDEMYKLLNESSKEHVFRLLRKRIPFEETKQYLKRVRDLMEKEYKNIN